jgi:hypothetical protein
MNFNRSIETVGEGDTQRTGRSSNPIVPNVCRTMDVDGATFGEMNRACPKPTGKPAIKFNIA